MEVSTTIGLLAIVASALYFYINHVFTYWKRKGFPYLEPSIPFGNIERNTHFAIMLENMYKKFKTIKCGPVGGVYLFQQPFAMATDLDFVKRVLIKDFQYFTDRGLYYNEKDDPLSAHLLSLRGERWRQLRNKLTPTFTSGKMKFMYPTVRSVADQFIRAITDAMDSQTEVDLDMKEMVSRYTTDVIGTCAFGIDCNSLTDPNAEFLRMGRRAIEVRRYSPSIVLFMSANQLFFNRLGAKILLDDVSEFFTKIVRETVGHRTSNDVQRNDFMSLLLGAKGAEALTENEIAAQVFLFFVAGFETSSTTMSFMMYELMVNQDVQDKAREEVQMVLARHNGELTYEATMEMEYMEQVVNETLRKHPPIGNLGRQLVRDYPMPDDRGKVLQKGLNLFIPVFAIHHDPMIYPEPDKFIPERFSPEQIMARHSAAFLPFGEGPRNCIGQRFAMMKIRVAMAALLMSFQIKPCNKSIIPLEYNAKIFTLSPVGGIWLKLERI